MNMQYNHGRLAMHGVGLLVTGLLSTGLQAAEPREWMSRQGGTLMAELVSLNGEQVVLNTPESREVKLKVKDLSLADRQHLVEFGGADASIITDSDSGLPEKDVRIDSSTFKRLPDKLALGEESEGAFELMETPHFLIATAGGIRPQNFAETAERLWHGMAFQHMNFRKDWGDKRMLIFAAEDRAAHQALGKWASETLAALGENDAARRNATLWDQVGSTSIYLPDTLVDKHKLLPRALVFNIKDNSRYRRAMSPFPIHTIAGSLLSQQMGGVSSYSSEGYFAITTGHSYFKEIQLGGKSETNLLDMSGSTDEISSKSGFDDGTSWARTLRSLVRKGTIEPKLENMLKFAAADLNPERLVSIYALAYYMQSDSKRLSAFASMIRRIESSNQIPEPIEIARLFGFETVEAFDADWKEFILKGDFR
jgi:hypothetical protein